MSRLQISDQFDGGRLQTQARPIAQTEAVAPARQGDHWRGLAAVFAQGELLVENARKVTEAKDTERATAYANSLTVSELSKQIKEGALLASESPVFAATVQHIWGQNSQDALEREVLSKVATGEQKFSNPAEIDQYLTDSRNSTLEGQSKYAGAGFDKNYPALRGKLMDSVARVNDKEVVEQAANQASDSLSNALLKVTGPEYKGTPQEAATAVLDQYHLLRHTQVMPDATSKGALMEVITRAATSGKKEVLASLLESTLPDLGTVRAFLGETKAATLVAQAGSQFDQGQRKRLDDEVLPHMLASDDGSLNIAKFESWYTDPANKEYVSASTIHGILNRNRSALAHQQVQLEKANIQGAVIASEYEAQKRVDAALSAGTLWVAQGTNNPQVLTTSGSLKDFDVKGYAEQALKAKTAALPFDQQVSAWAMNGLVNPNWDNQLKAGLNNLASIGVDAKGKPTGELNESGKKAIELFKQLDTTSPDAARQTAGETAYKRFSDIAFLMHLGRDASDAASIATNSATGALAGSPTDKLEKQVRAEVDKLVDTPWLDWLANTRDDAGDLVRLNNPVALTGALAYGVLKDWGGVENPPEWLKPDRAGTAMRNTTPNTAQVHSWVKRYATLLTHSGQVGDASAALKLAVDYISNPKVSAKVNGTLYLRSELPTAPSSGASQDEWLERFIDAVPKARAKELSFAGEQVRVEYDDRTRVYRAFVAGIPLTDASGGVMAWQRGSIQQWYAAQHRRDVEKATQDGADIQASKAHEGYRKRLWGEVGGLQQNDKYVMERYDANLNKPILEARIFSKAAYQRIVKDGNQNKPLGELMQLYPSSQGRNKPRK